HQLLDVRSAPGNLTDMGRQPDRRKMRLGARGLRGWKEPLPGRELARQRHAERDRLAVQKTLRVAGRRLERVAEGVAEIEQSTLAGLALVAADDRGLHPATGRDGVLTRRAAREHFPPVRLQPGEERRVAEKPIL